MIVAAAIQLIGEKKVYSFPAPARHHTIMHWMYDQGIKVLGQDIQGFVDSDLGFVDRKEAAFIAITQGQVKDLISPPNLYSEDLW